MSIIFLSVQIFSQTQSLASRISFSNNSHLQTDSLLIEKSSKSFLFIPKIVGQEAAGIVVGCVTGYVLGLSASWIGSDHNRSMYRDGAIYGALLGYALGNATIIYWTGNTKEIQGSFGYTLLGSLGGMVIGVYLHELKKNNMPIYILPGVGGIIAFYLSAEEVVPAKTDALIQIQNEKIQFGAPRIFLTRIDDTSNKLRYNFELLRVNF
ncbi:MAG: hypothetical protein A2057_14375 [Ignavibacteria bacterium GWA2_35_9]|nr:MAG: hypothetical protein A2057_14375 [Ignavibacteria bacterium GWA2_35_9]